MNQQIQTSFNNTLQNQTLYINYAINNVLLNVNTILPAVITAIDGLRCSVQTIINTLVVNQPSPPPITITNVPIAQYIGGNAGFIVDYQTGDVVLVGCIQRDISSIKDIWSQSNPASARKFSLSDAIVLFKLSNTLPTSFVRVTDNAIDITASAAQPITITTQGNVIINAGTATINATTADINASAINLGSGASNSVLIGGVPVTATITGVQSGSDTVTTTFQASAGGSSSVKATP